MYETKKIERHYDDGRLLGIFYINGEDVEDNSWRMLCCHYESPVYHRRIWRHQKPLHRIDGPAVEIFYDTGRIQLRKWFINDKSHRTDGPAIIEFKRNGKITHESYWFNGLELTQQEHKRIVMLNKLGMAVDPNINLLL